MNRLSSVISLALSLCCLSLSARSYTLSVANGSLSVNLEPPAITFDVLTRPSGYGDLILASADKGELIDLGRSCSYTAPQESKTDCQVPKHEIIRFSFEPRRSNRPAKVYKEYACLHSVFDYLVRKKSHGGTNRDFQGAANYANWKYEINTPDFSYNNASNLQGCYGVTYGSNGHIVITKAACQDEWICQSTLWHERQHYLYLNDGKLRADIVSWTTWHGKNYAKVHEHVLIYRAQIARDKATPPGTSEMTAEFVNGLRRSLKKYEDKEDLMVQVETTVRRFIAEEAGVEPGSFEYKQELEELIENTELSHVINEIENEYGILFTPQERGAFRRVGQIIDLTIEKIKNSLLPKL
ncbi:MAG: hypothetical protein IJJ33_10480 [Victivallales bacterium]|nr:hypothetical protein [Victivallales bacterium]